MAVDTKKILIRSNRTQQEYEASLYIKGESLIITHRSLDAIYYNMSDDERPNFRTEVVDTSKWPGTAPQYALKGIMEGKDGVVLERIGSYLDEMRLCNPKTSADYIYPIEKCERIAFDRVFIRYMQFDINAYAVSALYSTEEIALDGDTIRLDGKNVANIIGSSDVSNQAVQMTTPVQAPVPATMTAAPMPVQNPVPQASIPAQNSAPAPAPVPVSTQPVNSDIVASSAKPKKEVKIQKKESAKPALPDAPFPVTQEPAVVQEEKNVEPNTQTLPEQLPFNPDDFLPSYDPQEIPGLNIPQNDEMPGNDIPNEAPMLPPGFDVPDMNSMPQMPDIPNSSIAEQVVPNFPQPVSADIAVYRVTFDFAVGKSRIETNIGAIIYDPYTNRFEGEGIDITWLNLDALYQKASESIGMPLNEFNGTINI